jgi:hypothetical protein
MSCNCLFAGAPTSLNSPALVLLLLTSSLMYLCLPKPQMPLRRQQAPSDEDAQLKASSLSDTYAQMLAHTCTARL